MSDKGVLDISLYMYEVLNQSVLTDEISGNIYRHAETLNNDNENVIILTANLDSSVFRGVQNGFVNVNIEMPALSNGMPNIARFTIIADIIRQLLTDNNLIKKGFYFRILSENIFKEQKQNANYYYNFKLQTQNI